MLSLNRSRSAKLLAAVSAVGLLLSPAVAAPAKKAPAVAVSFDPLSTFTPAGADPNGPEGAIVVAGSWDEWIDRMRRHGQWGDSGIGADPETELWRRLAELNPHSNYAK